MYEGGDGRDRTGATGASAAGPDAAAVRLMVAALATGAGPAGAGEDAGRVDLLRALEELKNAASGLQVAVAAAFDVSQRAEQVAAGERAERVGRGIAAQVALARRCSPHRGAQHLSLARVLPAELPCTFAVLRKGRISELGASLVARGTACLSLEDRLTVDAEIAGDPGRIESMGERGIAAAVGALAARLDPASVVEQRRRAEKERCVTLRSTPDTMTYLTALLPVADGVAVYAALTRAADTARSSSDERTRGQVMADGLRDAVLGTAAAEAGARAALPGAVESSGGQVDRPTPSFPGPTPSLPGPAPARPREAGDLGGVPAGVGVVLNVIMSERQLFGSGEQSEGEALLGGLVGAFHGVDADQARQIAATTPADRVWLRRLYTHPESGELVAMDSRRRRFPEGMQRLIRFRDQHCRTPWCRAPVRHGDHALPRALDGPTSLANGQGLCEACNHAKEAPGWVTRPLEEQAAVGRHRVQTTTPTGHSYVTGPPEPPGRVAEVHAPRLLWSTKMMPTIDVVELRPRDAA